MLKATLHSHSDRTQEIEIERKNYPIFIVYGGFLYMRESDGEYKQTTLSFHIVKPRSVRAKFICQFNAANDDTQRDDVVLTPVTANPPTPENLTFWKAIPAGQIFWKIDNPPASGYFKPGADYYVDFTAADLAEEDTAIWKQ